MKPGWSQTATFKTALSLIFVSSLVKALSSQIYFGVTPIRFELKARPGEQITEVIYVRNNSSKPMRIKAYPENWFLKEDGTRMFVGNQPASYSCREWVKVNPFDFRLQPEEVRSVRFTMSVPPEAEPGGYHTTVSFENVPEAAGRGQLGQVAFTGKIVAAVYVVVGKVQIEGSLEDMTFESAGENQFIKLFLKNPGKTHFRLKGEIHVRTPGGIKVVTLPVPDEPVLPESQRFVTIRLEEKIPPGDYRLEARLDIGRDELLAMKKEIIIK